MVSFISSLHLIFGSLKMKWKSNCFFWFSMSCLIFCYDFLNFLFLSYFSSRAFYGTLVCTYVYFIMEVYFYANNDIVGSVGENISCCTFWILTKKIVWNGIFCRWLKFLQFVLNKCQCCLFLNFTRDCISR